MRNTKGHGKAPSRAKIRERQLRQAAATKIPPHPDVIVVGGGAAGLVAAITAAEHGAETVVIERDLECGRTILATGNGRCNLANAHLDPACYNAPGFVQEVVGDTWIEDVLAFFRDCGLAVCEEDEGRLYPVSRQAASVRDVLLARAARAGVTLACAREVTRVRETTKGLIIEGCERFGTETPFSLRSPAVVLAEGHNRLEAAGISQRPLTGVLCPLAVADDTVTRLDGRRAQATLTLKRAGATVATESGEVLFRQGALSGICVFNLSRLAHAGDTITLDLMPTLTLGVARHLATHTLAGVLDPQIAAALTERTGSAAAALVLAKSWEIAVEGVIDSERAQVMRGGLELSAFSAETLQAHDHPGLFACGEALDVDGPCGGYNLSWAWKSGMVAGAGAASLAKR